MNSIPTVTKNLLIINVLCFFGGVVAMKYGIDLNDLLGLHFFMASDFNPAQLITYMFMHGGFQHIFFNMFALWMFGRTLEHTYENAEKHGLPERYEADVKDTLTEKPQTNADRIRSMTDEELAEVLFGSCIEHMGVEECSHPEEACKSCVLDWLKAESEE